MIKIENPKIENICIHLIGNRLNEEVVKFSHNSIELEDELRELLSSYFFMPFLRSSEYYNFTHETDINLNEAFVYASQIFDNPESLYEQSVNLAKHLYEQSVHPKIKGGEFYTVYFKDCIWDGKTVDAVGLFKSENKDTFLKVYPAGDGFNIESEKGVNINKLDKGCLIFNTERENGYVVAVVDNTNRGVEARYWIDDFLHVQPRRDEYHDTHNVLSLCKNFVTKELPQQFEMSKADQADLLNRSVQFFKNNDNFSLQDFANEVMEQPDVIESFTNYRETFQREQEVAIADNFTISDSAVKKQSRRFRSVIKLDKNFHIYVHGNRELIEQGTDEKGRKFYKIYYDEES